MSLLDKFKKKSDAEELADNSQAKQAGNVAKSENQKKDSNAEKKSDDGVKKAAAQKPAKPADFGEKSGDSIFGVLIRPIITEKSSDLGQLNKYVFEVSANANKIQISQAIKSRYGVKPIDINIINNRGKLVRYGRTFGKQKNWKKAIITLPKDKSIQIYEGV